MLPVAGFVIALGALIWGVGSLVFQTSAIGALFALAISGLIFEALRRGWLTDD